MGFGRMLSVSPVNPHKLGKTFESILTGMRLVPLPRQSGTLHVSFPQEFVMSVLGRGHKKPKGGNCICMGIWYHTSFIMTAE